MQFMYYQALWWHTVGALKGKNQLKRLWYILWEKNSADWQLKRSHEIHDALLHGQPGTLNNTLSFLLQGLFYCQQIPLVCSTSNGVQFAGQAEAHLRCCVIGMRAEVKARGCIHNIRLEGTMMRAWRGWGIVIALFPSNTVLILATWLGDQARKWFSSSSCLQMD